jgi:hypothetical protein
MKQNKIKRQLNSSEVSEIVKGLKFNFSPSEALLGAEKEMNDFKEGRKEVSNRQNISLAMSLYEFDNAGLLVTGVSEEYRTFVNDFSKKLQLENDCQKESEKSLAHITALNFVRIMQIQAKIRSYLSKDSVTDIGVGYLNVMSKELDRAERHYITSLNELRSMRMPKLSMSIKTNTAVVGSNQMVQVRDS